MRRSSAFYLSLQRPKTVQGTDPYAFYAWAFLASFMFSGRMYLGLPLIIPAYLLSRSLTKRDPLFMKAFLRYLDEAHAFSGLPRPSDIMNRPRGWGRGLPW
jgi:hypothetical protein